MAEQEQLEFGQVVEKVLALADHPAIAILAGGAAGGKFGAAVGGNMAKFFPFYRKRRVVAACAMAGALVAGGTCFGLAVWRKAKAPQPAPVPEPVQVPAPGPAAAPQILAS